MTKDPTPKDLATVELCVRAMATNAMFAHMPKDELIALSHAMFGVDAGRWLYRPPVSVLG